MQKKKLLILIFLSFFILIGSFIRLYKIEDVPAGLLQDEAAAGFDAYSLIKSGKDHHGKKFPVTFQTFNDYTGHSFNYQLIPFIKLLGLSVFSVRFAVAFLSIVSIPLIYFLVSEIIGGVEVPLLVSFLYSLSQFSVMNSRWAVQPNTVPFFIILSLLLLFLGMNRAKKRRILWTLAGVLFALSCYSYPSVEGFIPIWLAGVFLILFGLEKDKEKKELVKDIGIMILSLIIVFLPLFLDHIKKPETITTKLGMVSVFTQKIHPLVLYFQNYLSYLLPNYLFFAREVNPTRVVPGYGYENVFLAIFYYLGLLLLFAKRQFLIKKYPQLNSRKIYILIWSFFAFPIIPSLTVPAGDFQRAIYFLPMIIFFISLGIVFAYNLIKDISKKTKTSLTFYFILVFSLLYFYSQYSFYSSYFGKRFRVYQEWYMQYGMDKVVNYVIKNENKYKNIIIDNTINQPYIYFLFYQKTNPKTLIYKDFATVDPKSNWLSVEKFNSYRFKRIEKEDVEGAKLIESIYNSPFSVYAIYAKGDEMLVDFQVVRDVKVSAN